ncbi:hypothetical protein R3P38DRAFT_2934529 [Favolaschia claudopus]|uniref:Uncharacterized protein n=1 Tax=Favolaschia claudopus TaxID=2862362 RepID=A0AAW0BSI2_9AGAR
MASDDSDDDVTVLDGPSRFTAKDLNEMIEGVIADNPDACNKFLVRTPEIMAAQAKKNAAKKTPKRKRKDSDDTGNEDKPPSKRKAEAKEETSDTDEPPAKITYYINIAKPAPPAPKKRGAPKANDDDTLQKGPILLPVTASYNDLLSAIASELPCLVQNINQSKIFWKTKKPANGEKSPLGKAVGYEAMVDDVKGVKGKASRPWETKDSPPPTFDYSELERAGPNDSVMEQKISFNNATRAERAKLEEAYPIGNDPRWPNLRIYQQPLTGFCFDLNKTRLDVWAASMSQNLTDHKTAPASRFFDAQQRIKNIPSMTIAPAPAAGDAPPPPAPAIPAAPPPATPTPALSITDIFLASIMSNGGISSLFPQLSSAHTATPPATNPAIAPPAPPPPRSAPASPMKRHNVSLDQFCEHYGLAEGDSSLLKDVGFRPGDKTTSALDEELRNASFTIFSWRRIHDANVRFKGDLASGMFDG